MSNMDTNFDLQNYLHLTESGLQIAERIYERHRFLTDALISLGIDPETAEDDACHMEHYVSDETFSAMKAYCAGNRQKQKRRTRSFLWSSEIQF